MPNREETSRIPQGLSWASHATMMAVKPTPPATPAASVLFAPVAWTMPAIPATAPLRNMVRSTILLTFIPAYAAVAWLSPTTLISYPCLVYVM